MRPSDQPSRRWRVLRCCGHARGQHANNWDHGSCGSTRAGGRFLADEGGSCDGKGTRRESGCPIGADHLKGRGYDVAAREAQRTAANDRAADLAEVLADLVKDGFTSANAQARELNARGIVTARGGKWSAQSVLNVKARIA